MGRKRFRNKASNLRVARRSKGKSSSCEESTIRDESRVKENEHEEEMEEEEEVVAAEKRQEQDGEVEEKSATFEKGWRRETPRCSVETSVPIDVHSRLMYPLIRSQGLSGNSSSAWSSESEDEEERVELNVKPRFVFVSSLCAICLKKSRIFCERCRMVSYCSTMHRSQGLSQHRDLCEALTEIRSSIASTLSADEPDGRLDAEQYRVYRVHLLGILESKIRRPLKLWEREIVLYPRVCRICRRFGEKLVCCAHCAMEYFCERHSTEHEKWCKEFRTLQRCLYLQYKHGCVNPRIPNVRRQMFVARADVGFDELMHEIYGNSSYYRRMDCYTYSTLSHLSTIPLTALYSMQISCPEWQSNTDWTIHVLGAEFQFEGVHLHVWEKLFLHFLPNLRRLGLVLIGPELRLPSGVPPKALAKIKLCSACKAAGKAVNVSFRPGMLYHELVRENESAERVAEPDLICIFNPGLYRKTGFAGNDSWLETIREFCKKSTAVAITSYTVDEMFWEIARIKSVADIEILLQPQRNPFASIKPDRNFVSDDIDPLIYKNYYIYVVKGKPTLT